MDSFEMNKIAGAVLGAGLVAMASFLIFNAPNAASTADIVVVPGTPDDLAMRCPSSTSKFNPPLKAPAVPAIRMTFGLVVANSRAAINS